MCVRVRENCRTQSNETKEEAKEQEKAEQEGQEPLPPAAAGAQAESWVVFTDL